MSNCSIFRYECLFFISTIIFRYISVAALPSVPSSEFIQYCKDHRPFIISKDDVRADLSLPNMLKGWWEVIQNRLGIDNLPQIPDQNALISHKNFLVRILGFDKISSGLRTSEKLSFCKVAGMYPQTSSAIGTSEIPDCTVELRVIPWQPHQHALIGCRSKKVLFVSDFGTGMYSLIVHE